MSTEATQTTVTRPPAKPAAAKVTDAQLASAMKAVMAIIGCGEIDAKTRVSQLDAAKIVTIAQLEDAGKRKEVVTILYS